MKLEDIRDYQRLSLRDELSTLLVLITYTPRTKEEEKVREMWKKNTVI